MVHLDRLLPPPQSRMTRKTTTTTTTILMIVRPSTDIARHPPRATDTARTADTAAATARAAVGTTARTRARTRRRAAHPRPRRTRTVPRPRRIHSRRPRKSAAIQASPCPHRRCLSPPAAPTAARCDTGSGIAGAIISRRTSTSCTRRRTARTHLSWSGTRPRRRGTGTTLVISSSTMRRGKSCRRACRGRGICLYYLMTRSVPSIDKEVFFFSDADGWRFLITQFVTYVYL